MNNENRRQFLRKFGFISLITGTGSFSPAYSFDYTSNSYTAAKKSEFVSFPSSDLFSVLNLELPELTEVKKALTGKGHEAALAALLKYYRTRYPKPSVEISGTASKDSSISRANDLEKHIFQWGPYEAFNYGPDIDWSADPAGDIEWVASVYRFNWANDLVNAFLKTGDERYAGTFVDLTTDWIIKHPLEKTIDIVHPVYGPGVYGSVGWKGYPWLDLQTGIRATNICRSFRTFIHTKAFTPQFLGMLMASLYDHQLKTEKMPMNKVHNKAIFEQRGFMNVLHTFPEYKDKDRWLDIAMGITCENLLAQTTTDGVQREWCGGYHSGVYRDVLEIRDRVHDLGREMPHEYNNRVKAMADHIFGISTPDLGFPMFGDTARSKRRSNERTSWQLYRTLTEASEKFNDPKYQALADLNTQYLPSNGSIAFSEAGLYAMRNRWTPDQVYMALHCSPPAYSSHDTPDNGTFELYAFGRWLMPDTGFFTYGHDREARAWHRQTRVHSTMTVNGKDTNIIGRQLLWQSSEDLDVLCVENYSYQYFLHRRTIWFAGKKSEIPFFVVLDEAIGDAKGDIAIHFPMAPGTVKIDNRSGSILTDFDDVNLLVKITGKKTVALTEEEGWHAWEYGKREKRKMVSAIYKGQGPTVFVSILVPFKGKVPPDVSLLSNPLSLIAGMDPVNLDVMTADKRWSLSRKL
jgi:heparan-sulfate lyase